MSKLDIFTMALRNLFKRKLRTALTILGVVIGTTSIVVMISIGIGINMSFENTIKEMGDVTTIEIWHNTGENGRVLLDKDIDEILKIDGVLAATPKLETYITMASGKYTAELNIVGIRPEAMEAFGFPIAKGRALDKDSEALEVVFGSSSPERFMSARERALEERSWRSNRGMVVMVDNGTNGGEEEEEKTYNVNVLEDKIQMSYVYGFGQKQSNTGEEENGEEAPTEGQKTIKPYNVVGVGIMSGERWEYSWANYMDIEFVKQLTEDRAKYEKSQGNRYADTSKFEERGYNSALVKASDIKYVEKIVEELEKFNFSYVWSPTSYITGLKKTAASLQGLLGAIGAVALFVAAIGIANTMIMSIYERTREIGVMKVIGAALKDIRDLFLIEAALIGLFGGILGIGLSLGVSYVLNNMDVLSFLDMFSAYGEQASNISYIPAWLCGVSLIFSSLIGLISGYLPARRAMKLSALSAIRTD